MLPFRRLPRLESSAAAVIVVAILPRLLVDGANRPLQEHRETKTQLHHRLPSRDDYLSAVMTGDRAVRQHHYRPPSIPAAPALLLR